jgi:cobalt-zinc-cadmium efflux system membrane fusion protein
MSIDLEVWKSLSEEELQKRVKFLGLPESIVNTLDPNSTTATLLPLAAPFDGVVIGRELSKGEVVAPGQGHLEIADVRRMWIVLHVREQDVDDLRLGQAVVFATGNDSVTGSISWMSTAVDEKTRTVEVRCETENPFVLDKDSKPTSERVLRANVFGVGTIQLYENKAATVVPTKAVQRFADGPIVFVPQNGRTFEMQNVQIGVVNPEYTEVLSGLTDSQSVVVDGSHVFKAELQRMRGAK